MTTALLSVALGMVIGLSLGLLGGGGSILTVPALVYLVGVPVAQATGTSLAIVGLTALFGAVGHYRAGRAALRAGLGFGAASIAGSVAGSLLSRHVPAHVLLVLFAGLMIAAGVAMLRRRAVPETATPVRRPRSRIQVGAAGSGVGMLTGFFGVGGGFVIVPALTLVLGLPMRLAVGTSLVVIAIASAAGLMTHLGSGALDVVTTLFFVTGGLAGTLIGARLAGVVSERLLRRAFAVLVFTLAAYLLARNLPAVLAAAAVVFGR